MGENSQTLQPDARDPLKIAFAERVRVVALLVSERKEKKSIGLLISATVR